MKAEERIRKYGLEKYIRTCLHKEPTPELIEKYRKKYGEDIPYHVYYQGIVKCTDQYDEPYEVFSRAKKTYQEAREEAINRALKSPLKLKSIDEVEVRRIEHRPPLEKIFPPKKPEKREKKPVLSKEQVREVTEGLKAAGMTPEEIGRTLASMIKELQR